MSAEPDPALHDFDAATAVARSGPGRWAGATHPAYWAFVGPFGGATAATLLRAVLEEPGREGDPLSMTVNYCAPIAAGGFEIEVRRIRANRSSQHWLALLSQGGDEPAAMASLVTAVRRDSWSHQVATAPSRPDRAGLAPHASTVAPWVGQYDFRFAAGAPDYASGGTGETRSALWISDAEPRPLDHLSLASMADAFFGRIFHARRAIVPFGTVTMTTQFHADAADLAAERASMVFGVADARRFHKSYGDQTGELWSPSGRLLATTTQAFYFKA